MITVISEKTVTEIIAEVGQKVEIFLISEWIGEIIITPKHPFKLSVICELISAFVIKYYFFRHIVMAYEVKHFL